MLPARALPVVVCLFASACGGSGSDPEGQGGSGAVGGSGGAGSSGGGVGAGGDSGGTTGGDPCADDDAPPEEGSICLAEVQGRIFHEDGTPPEAGDEVSVCGPICHFGETAADGSFAVEIGRHVLLEQYSTLPHGRPLIAGYYFPLPTDEPGPVVDVGDLVMIQLPEMGAPLSADPVADAQLLTSGEVTLEIAAGVETRLEIDEVLAGDLGSQFRSRAVAADLYDTLGVAEHGFSSLYAMGPFEAQFLDGRGDSVGARLSFENAAGLPAGAAVEFWALGSYLYPEVVTPAVFEPVATGAVTADGSRIEMDDGEAVYLLTWIGIREVAP